MFGCVFVMVFIFKQRICLLFFIKMHLTLKVFTQGELFSLNGCLSLFSVKLCSAKKFMIRYSISITQWIYQIHIVTQCFCQFVVKANVKISIV